MIELLTGEVLFHDMTGHYHALSTPVRWLLAGTMVLMLALLVMMLVSLVSYVIGGAPFIVSSKRMTRKIVSLAGIQPGEVVYDLGCGDGRFLIAADKSYGAHAVGVEISPLICLLARLTVWIHGAHAAIRCGKYETFDLSDADVIFCYLGPDKLTSLAERFDRLKPGTRVLSRRFEIPGKKPDRSVLIRRGFGTETIYIYQIEKDPL